MNPCPWEQGLVHSVPGPNQAPAPTPSPHRPHGNKLAQSAGKNSLSTGQGSCRLEQLLAAQKSVKLFYSKKSILLKYCLVYLTGYCAKLKLKNYF